MMPLLQQAGPLTLFFPTDEAFRDMDAHSRLALLKGEGCVDCEYSARQNGDSAVERFEQLELTSTSLPAFVRNLMVKHTVCTAAAALRVRAPNMDGEYLLLERAASDDGKLFLEDAELGAHDIMASNGVLHLLNKVIVPDSGRSAPRGQRARPRLPPDVRLTHTHTRYFRFRRRAAAAVRLKLGVAFPLLCCSQTGEGRAPVPQPDALV